VDQKEIRKQQIKGSLSTLFTVVQKEDIDKIMNNLKPEEFSEDDWKKLNTEYQSLLEFPQRIEDIYQDIKEKLGKLIGFGNVEARMEVQKENLSMWIRKILTQIEGILNLVELGSQENLRKGISSDISNLYFDLEFTKKDLESERIKLIKLLDNYKLTQG